MVYHLNSIEKEAVSFLGEVSETSYLAVVVVHPNLGKNYEPFKKFFNKVYLKELNTLFIQRLGKSSTRKLMNTLNKWSKKHNNLLKDARTEGSLNNCRFYFSDNYKPFIHNWLMNHVDNSQAQHELLNDNYFYDCNFVPFSNKDKHYLKKIIKILKNTNKFQKIIQKMPYYIYSVKPEKSNQTKISLKIKSKVKSLFYRFF